MRVLAIDTETTGLPPKGPPTKCELWPHIVQLSYVIFDTDTNEIIESDHVLRVPGEIPTTHIHGITKERSNAGEEFSDVYNKFAAMLISVDIVVGHNLEFDLNMIRAECARRQFRFETPTGQYCTMRESKERVGIRTESGYIKYPRLGELYEFLFHEPPSNWHNALADAYMSLRCFHMLVLKRDNVLLKR